VHDIYLTKEQQLQGKVAWLFKDPNAWDAMCEWWTSLELRAISEQNRLNRQSKPSVHHYGVDVNLFVTLYSMLQKKNTGAEPHY
jgi:hypothetical protein